MPNNQTAKENLFSRGSILTTRSSKGNHPKPFAGVITSRIGHFLIECESIIKLSRIYNRKLLQNTPVCNVLYNPVTIANLAALEIFPPEINFIPCDDIESYSKYLKASGCWLDIDAIAVAMYKSAYCYSINAVWGKREPVVQIPQAWVAKGDSLLRELGLPENQRFVCFHARTGAYSPSDESAHYLRNSNISDYDLAIDYLVSQGFYVIRMGNKSMPPITPRAKVIDYGISETKKDWLDLYIGSKCHFFVCGPSGAGTLASVFGNPIVLVNGSLPFNFSFTGTFNQVGIPKMMLNNSTGQLIDFESIFKTDLGAERMSDRFLLNNIRLVENSKEEILEVVIEMEQRLSGSFVISENDYTRQVLIHNLIPQSHYIHGTASKFGRDFLRRYSYLLPGY